MAFAIGVIDYEMLIKLIVAAIAGGLIGLEREALHKPAGVRTHMLVSLGSALFVLATLSIIPDEVGRIIAGIATGIGFLGAGTIFRSKDHVVGLTSAASIWAVAAIGLTVGGGQYVLAIAATILVILILQLKRYGL
ncbi:MgtC/SapB family protein [Candidatus Woesearchaeota archaeon]|nr:MgtC/SapB family protein [Candidatus Woesearchaeota archaeon]